MKDSGLRQSMSRCGNCWDNAPQESFYGHIDVCLVIHDWMDYYNNERYQWDLAKLSPNEFFECCRTGPFHFLRVKRIRNSSVPSLHQLRLWRYCPVSLQVIRDCWLLLQQRNYWLAPLLYGKNTQNIFSLTLGTLHLDLTQREFGEHIAIKQNSVAQIEMGRNTSDQTIFAICKTFNVSESMALKRRREMFVQPSKEDELSAAVERLLSGGSSEFKRRFVVVLSKLDIKDLLTKVKS